MSGHSSPIALILIGRKLAHYEIIGQLGKGGMGEVYRARDPKLGRDVAIKIVPTEMSGDPERVARFQREARTLASLQHAHIATIHGFEEADGRWFHVQEYVKGDTLQQIIERGPVDLDLVRANQLTDGYCLKRPANSSFIFYRIKRDSLLLSVVSSE